MFARCASSAAAAQLWPICDGGELPGSAAQGPCTGTAAAAAAGCLDAHTQPWQRTLNSCAPAHSAGLRHAAQKVNRSAAQQPCTAAAVALSSCPWLLTCCAATARGCMLLRKMCHCLIPDLHTSRFLELRSGSPSAHLCRRASPCKHPSIGAETRREVRMQDLEQQVLGQVQQLVLHLLAAATKDQLADPCSMLQSALCSQF